jgi:GAF domain-containing protein
LLASGAALLNGRNRREVFQRILEGVERLGFRRVRLYLISPDQETLTCAAQAGMETDVEGCKWSAAGDRTTHVLLTEPWPHPFEAAAENPDQHAIRLGRTNGDRWVEAPLVLESKVVGKISADNEHDPLPGSLDLDLLDLFAQQAAAVLEKSRLLDEARHRLAMFEQLRDVAKTLASAFDLRVLLESIVKNAVALADDLFRQAREKFERVLKIKPDMTWALNSWGKALAEQARQETGQIFTTRYALGVLHSRRRRSRRREGQPTISFGRRMPSTTGR